MAFEPVQVRYEADTTDVENAQKRVGRGFRRNKAEADSFGSSSGMRRMARELERLETQLKINGRDMDLLQKKAALLKERIADPVSPDVSRENLALQKYAEQIEKINTQLTPLRQQMKELSTWPQTGEGASLIQAEIAKVREAYDALIAKREQLGNVYEATENKIAARQATASAAEKDRAELAKLEIQMQKLELRTRGVSDRFSDVNAKMAANGQAAVKARRGLSVMETGTKSLTGALKAFGMMLRRVLVFMVVIQGIREFAQYLYAGMSANEEFAQSLNAIKVNLLTAFQPILSVVVPLIQKFIGWLANATAQIAAFVAALFGSTYAAQRQAAKLFYETAAAAKAVGGGSRKMAKDVKKSAAEIKGTLASFDQFNDITMQTLDNMDDIGGGGGGGAIPNPFENLKEVDVKDAENFGSALRAGLEWLFKDGLGGAIKKWFTTVLPLVWRNIFDKLREIFGPIGEWFVNKFQTIWYGIKEVFAPIGGWFGNKFHEARTNVEGVFSNIGIWFSERGNDIKTFFLESVPDRFKEKFTNARTNVETVFGTIGTWFETKWTDVKTLFLEKVPDFFKEKFDSARRNAETAFDGIGTFFENLWHNKIKPAFVDIGTRVGEAVGEAFRKAINAALATVEKGLNAPIDMINGLLNTIQQLTGSNIGRVAKITLPRLAAGGLAYGATLALVGDNKGASVGNPEVIAPLDRLQDIVTAAILQRDIAAGGGAVQPIEVRMMLDDGSTLVRMLVDPMNQTAKQLGYRAVFTPV